MAQDGFSSGFHSGMGGGLQMFSVMQHAAYQQQLMQNADENQQMRRQDQAAQMQARAAQQFQQRFDRNKFVIEHADKMGTDMVIDAYNDMNTMQGGKHKITQLDLDTFKTDSGKYLNDVKSAPDDETANKLMGEYRSKAATHPIFNQIGNFQLKLMEDARSRNNLIKEMDALGIGNRQWREKFVKDGDPTVIREMVKNNDQRGMLMYQYAQDTLLRHESGGNVSPKELSDAIGFLHTKGGGALGKEGKAIFEPANRAQFHQETGAALTEAQTTFKPLTGAIAAIKPDDLQALKDAKNSVRTYAGYLGTDDGKIYGGLGLVKHVNDAVAKTEELFTKYPQLGQTLKQIGPQAIEQARTLQDQLEQLQRDKKAMTAAVTVPHRTEQLERLDYQIKLKQQQLDPWNTVVRAYQSPESPEAVQGLLKVGGTITKLLDSNEQQRVLNLTESEQHARAVLDKDNKKFHVDDVGPAEVGNQVFQWIAQHPQSTDEQRLGKIAELSAAYKKQTGFMPDQNKIAQRIVAMRTKAEDTTVTKLTPEQGFKFETAVTGAENTRSLIGQLFPGGKFDRGTMATAIAGGLPFTGGRTIQAYIKDALDAEYRARTGAAMPDSEWDRAQDTFVPGQLDNEKTASTKLQNLLRHFENKLNIVDPDSKLRSRVKPVTPVGDAGKSDAPRKAPKVTLDGFKQFWNENKEKFNGDMDAAAQAYHQG